MTDKQIIIDDVNVSGCVRLQDDEISCDLGGECKGWENCYYKQLKRKEQECEALQMSENEAGEIIAELQAYKDVNEDFKTAWKELKAENEELKKIINEAKSSSLDLKSFLVCEAVQNEYEQQLDQLKVDRGEALKQLEFVRTLNTVKEAETRKLSKALAEIKEIAEIFCNACQEFEPKKRSSNCMYCNYGKILQKISECELE